MYKLILIREGEVVAEVAKSLDDDLDALDAARAHCQHCIVEVYNHTRLVARVKMGDEPLNVRDANSG